MTVTKDVIRDLMPLYLAGEASDDSRRLVDQYLRDHPDERPTADAFALPGADPPVSIEMASLDRTRRIYGTRSMALASAMAVSFSVFAFRFDKTGIGFVLFRDLPTVAWVLLAAAAAIWAVFLVLHRRWVRTGLSQLHYVRGAWMAGGALAVLPYAFVMSYHFGLDDVRGLCVAGAFLGAATGRALHAAPRKLSS